MRTSSPFTLLVALSLAGYLGCADTVEVLGPPLAEGAGEAGAPPAGSGGDAGALVSGSGGAPVGGTPGGEAGALDRGGQGGDNGSGGVPELPRVVRLDTGDSHTCAVLDGALYCWGQNQRGRLGVGDTLDRLQPTRVGADSAWSDVTTGYEHTCALHEDGGVYCFGVNDDGQLGIPGVNDVLEPLRVDLPRPAVSLSAEVAFTCAVIDDGALYCWGANAEGQLGQADGSLAVEPTSPVRVTEFSDFLAVDTGQGHACALRAPGTPYCWGRNTDSQLGLGAGAAGQLRVPTLVVDATDFSAIAAGQNHSCALRGAGELVCWGGNEHGNLGTGDLELRDSPTTILSAGINALSLDTFHTCALDQDGSLSCWGRNVEGQLAVGDTDDRLVPTPVAGQAFERVAVGRFFTCAVSREHRVLCTGANESGQLGFGDTMRRNAFEPLAYPFE